MIVETTFVSPQEFVSTLLKLGIEKLEWFTYFSSDEMHTEEVIFYNKDGEEIEVQDLPLDSLSVQCVRREWNRATGMWDPIFLTKVSLAPDEFYSIVEAYVHDASFIDAGPNIYFDACGRFILLVRDNAIIRQSDAYDPDDIFEDYLNPPEVYYVKDTAEKTEIDAEKYNLSPKKEPVANEPSIRKLTYNELLILAQQLKTLNIWKSTLDFAKSYYGEGVFKVVLNSYSEYDDQGGYYPVLDTMVVFDIDGNLLPLDLNSVRAVEIINDEKAKLPPDTVNSSEYILNLVEDDFLEHCGDIELDEEIGSHTYCVSQPPAFTFMPIYVPIDAPNRSTDVDWEIVKTDDGNIGFVKHSK